jgi:hypothetical protein
MLSDGIWRSAAISTSWKSSCKGNIRERSRRHMREECNTLIRNQTDHNPGKLYFAKMLSLPMQAPLPPLMNRFGFQSLGNEVES